MIIYKVNSMLDCACHRWQRIDMKRNKLSSARDSGLTSLDFVRGPVHNVH